MRKSNELAARAEDRAWSKNISPPSLGSIGLAGNAISWWYLESRGLLSFSEWLLGLEGGVQKQEEAPL